ncbi:uncharacterized protein [Salminus brasiliensis]|uniref:uncharacterized protein n=1 Tax=Salminus brasiliensis TaxID=930266 RepID=UPI003B837F53
MVRIQTLYSLSDLHDSGFGQPYPRHGLNLLYWFANHCVKVNNTNQVTAVCSPHRGDFGFRPFYNKDRLLPPANLPYYDLGNLNHAEAGDLPEYVRGEYTGYLDNSNTDRIIVCVNRFSMALHSIFVTRHRHQWTFDPDQTYCISPALIRTIRGMRREEFLTRAALRLPATPQSARGVSSMQAYQPSRNPAGECCQTFCSVLLFVLVLLVCLIIINLKK